MRAVTKPLHLTASICVLLVGASAALGNSGGHSGGGSSAGAGAGHGSAATQSAKASSPVSSAHRGIGRVRGGFRGDSAKPGEICEYNTKTCYRLVQLLNMGLRARREDGGTLTPEHRADLQTKLEALRAQAL